MPEKPFIWILDSARTPLNGCLDAFDEWADSLYFGPDDPIPDWEQAPDAIFLSAEMPGGPDGEWFANLCEQAGSIPLLAVTGLRSLAQAVAFFRAGAADYLTLPLEAEHARERFHAALRRSERLALTAVAVELETVDADAGAVRLSISPTRPDPAEDSEDILADLPPVAADDAQADQPDPDQAEVGEPEEPVAVDGLPIPTLWEELPCGLLVFDGGENLVFSNTLGMSLFGRNSLAELQDALERNLPQFAAYGANHKPLPDHQWPLPLAFRTRTARSAVVSIEKPDQHRVWLRIDCLPHISEGRISRLSMTVVNLTGELPPLKVENRQPVSGAKREKSKKRAKKRR